MSFFASYGPEQVKAPTLQEARALTKALADRVKYDIPIVSRGNIIEVIRFERTLKDQVPFELSHAEWVSIQILARSAAQEARDESNPEAANHYRVIADKCFSNAEHISNLNRATTRAQFTDLRQRRLR